MSFIQDLVYLNRSLPPKLIEDLQNKEHHGDRSNCQLSIRDRMPLTYKTTEWGQ